MMPLPNLIFFFFFWHLSESIIVLEFRKNPKNVNFSVGFSTDFSGRIVNPRDSNNLTVSVMFYKHSFNVLPCR